tara:strand:+ start:1942 stop:2673 length:732 start_codon:yes stop_codon:yes gene_type:complete
MMNCEAYKEALGADPSASFEGGSEHSADCASCSAFTEEMQAFEIRIAAALCIDTPDIKIPDLPEIEDDNVVELPFGRKSAIITQAWLAVAATVLLAVFVGFWAVDDYYAPSGLSLADEVLAHLDHEPGALAVTNVAVSNDQLSKVIRRSSGTMNANIGLVSYAKSCTINGRVIPHLVLQGEKGPITLLLMPEEMIDQATTLNGKGVNGVILPMGNGSIAIIGERGEPLTELEKSIINSVEWSI